MIIKSNAEISLLFSEEKFINLSQTQIIIKELSIKVFNIKKIYKKFNLCFYYKLQYFDFDIRNYFNKNKKKITLHIIKMHDNIININNDIIFSSENI